MTWLTPLAGAILAAVVLPPLILLYFLKLRRRTQPIGSTLLWKRSVEDLRANAPFQRLRFSILLLLQLLILCLLAASIMQPQIQAGGRKGGKTIILIDNSASMTARDGDEQGATRLDEAKRRAKDLIEEMYAGGLFSSSPGETMVIAFNERAEVACRFINSKQQILDAIDLIQPSHAETRLEEAFKLARAYTTNPNPDDPTGRPIGEAATVELFSDGRIADLGDQVLRGETMVYHQIGSPEPDNVAVASLAVSRPYDRPTAVEIFASLINHNFEPATCDVELSLNDTVLRIETITVGPAAIDPSTKQKTPGRNNVVFTPFEQPRGAVIQVRNLREDDLEADNAGRIVVPPPRQLNVALVEPKSFVLRTALEGMSLQSLRTLTVEQFDEIARAGTAEQFDLIAFDNASPTGLPPGRYLILGQPPPVEGLNPYGEPAPQLVLAIKDEHPVMKFVRLNTLYISKSQAIEPADDVKVIVEGSSSPLFVELSRGGAQILYVTFDPLDSNWPFLRSYVTFLFNAVEYLGQLGDSLTTQGFRPGDALSGRLPSAATDVAMIVPDGRKESVSVSATSFSWGPARLSGTYMLSWKHDGEDQARPIAVNLYSEAEGDIRPAPEIKVGQEVVEGTGKDDSAYTPLWPWAVGISILILMLEWWVYHRKTFA